MAMFGAPFTDEEHALGACCAALEMHCGAGAFGVRDPASGWHSLGRDRGASASHRWRAHAGRRGRSRASGGAAATGRTVGQHVDQRRDVCARAWPCRDADRWTTAVPWFRSAGGGAPASGSRCVAVAAGRRGAARPVAVRRSAGRAECAGGGVCTGGGGERMRRRARRRPWGRQITADPRVRGCAQRRPGIGGEVYPVAR